MSFWSSLALVRAAPPPIVRVAELAPFVRALAAAEAVSDASDVSCGIKYGPRVDADERTTDDSGEEADAGRIIRTVREYPWDRKERFSSVEHLAQSLASDEGTIYRAHLSLGLVHPELVAALSRNSCDENSVPMCLCELGFSIGPEIVSSLNDDVGAFAGWMALSIAGHGYCFPWTRREVRDRAERVAITGRLVEACRVAWPVRPERPPGAVVAARRSLGSLWLYDDPAQPADWLWFVSES